MNVEQLEIIAADCRSLNLNLRDWSGTSGSEREIDCLINVVTRDFKHISTACVEAICYAYPNRCIFVENRIESRNFEAILG